MSLIDAPSPAPQADPARPHRFTWDEAQRMVASGAWGEARVELIGGEIYFTPEEGFLHVDAVFALQSWLLAQVAPIGLSVRIREAVHMPDGSVIAPDLAVFPAGTDARGMQAPLAELLIEVADTSERRDRDVKLPRYAAAGVKEVWIVSAPAKAITRYRAPIDGAWSFVDRLEVGQAASPLCAANFAFDPKDLPEAAD